MNEALVGLFAGHKRTGPGFNLYSDWSRLGRPEMRNRLARELETLRDAMMDVVDLGFRESVRTALAETADHRPAVVRTGPAFRRTGRAAC
jgi:mRNA-degrading endonuclease toxin of MazEF toxin-antitoxin module